FSYEDGANLRVLGQLMSAPARINRGRAGFEFGFELAIRFARKTSGESFPFGSCYGRFRIRNDLRRFLQFQRRFLQKTARWCVQSCFDFHEARAGNKPAINRRRRRQCLSAPNPPGAKFSRWNIDIFLASDLVALLYFCLADRAVEAPTRSTL